MYPSVAVVSSHSILSAPVWSRPRFRNKVPPIINAANAVTPTRSTTGVGELTYYSCGAQGCTFQAKSDAHVKRHKASIHDIDVTYYTCDFQECGFKAKQKANLNSHKANKHEIGVFISYCDSEGCEYKCKKSGNLKRHKKMMHQIG